MYERVGYTSLYYMAGFKGFQELSFWDNFQVSVEIIRSHSMKPGFLYATEVLFLSVVTKRITWSAITISLTTVHHALSSSFQASPVSTITFPKQLDTVFAAINNPL
ncbi:unnamed protein product [Fusarium fujikuroi]|nr:unnamed protein product [Fusarium fujikuroi]